MFLFCYFFKNTESDDINNLVDDILNPRDE